MAQRSFKDAYGVLQKHAETLRDQDEPNIDDLLTIVTESVDAYKVCKERIDAVEAALKAALDGAGVGATTPGNAAAERAADAPAMRAPSSGRSARAASPPAGIEPEDDDIPF
ncbi:exodeoxyribonuclease VII small subunit [Variovorax boronicumulans]|uniref:Exodeoxyribonuclease VII small subunit n=1 Tax=Variovorax boronicumulans TaxID=436515 RepID=A0AAW8D6U2_9BURK|nr:exodeoxyribonuclease VII small subunit [Variovorax boronicumulans]MDP9896762.1 exodeoxyribonuclease VII small subunit [Variovorax boronicumulans]MDQ0036713.1 exodeoxyribonuclease VII small subunit [Variovorax boronicumulans]MDQ0056914.1 exodeoxyribonuclease VII small subunit [Variovorax boronicumulans]